MSLLEIAIILAVGAFAGLFAGAIIGQSRRGIVESLLASVPGAFLGGWILPLLNVRIGATPETFLITDALIGSAVLLIASGLVLSAIRRN